MAMGKTDGCIRCARAMGAMLMLGMIAALIVAVLPSYAWADEEPAESAQGTPVATGGGTVQVGVDAGIGDAACAESADEVAPGADGYVDDPTIDAATGKAEGATAGGISGGAPVAGESGDGGIDGASSAIAEETGDIAGAPPIEPAASFASAAHTAPSADNRSFLQVGNAVLFDGTKQDASTEGAFYTKSINRLTLNSTIRGAIVARFLGDDFTVFANDDTVFIASQNDDDDDPLLHVIGALTIDGKENRIVAIMGGIAVEKAGTGTEADGSLALDNVNLQVAGINADCSAPLVDVEGDVNVNSGVLGVTSLKNGTALNVGGRLTISGGGNQPKRDVVLHVGSRKISLAIEGKHAITNIAGDGATVGSDLRVADSKLSVFTLGGTGVSTKGSVYLTNAHVSIQSILDKQSSSNAPSATYGLRMRASKHAPSMLNVKDSTVEVTAVGFNGNDAAIYGPETGIVIDGGYVSASAPLSTGLLLPAGTVLIRRGTLDIVGAYVGMAAKALIVRGGALNAFALGALDLSDYDAQQLRDLVRQAEELAKSGDYSKYLSVLAQLRYLAADNVKGYAITSDTIRISGGTVTALALCNTALYGKSSGNEFIAINANDSILIEGGTVVALANAADEKSVAIGIHAGVPGRGRSEAKRGSIIVTGGTVTAYAFRSARHRLAMYAEPAGGSEGTVAIGEDMGAAAGAKAPGRRVDAGSLGTASPYTYLYLSKGRLYLVDEYLTWDSLGKELACFLVGFDPPNSQLKVTREMMQTLVGLNRPVMILSNDVDLVSGAWLESYLTAYVRSYAIDPEGSNVIMSGMFKGNGVVFLFETGSMFGKTTIHQVGGIDVYDFNVRYDTDPEWSMMSGLAGDRLIHSIHFYYQAGSWPADMTLFVHVGARYAGKTVQWHYFDALTGRLILQWSGTVDPFGWIEVPGQKALPSKETALCAPRQLACESVGRKALPATGDGPFDVLTAGLPLMALLTGSLVANAALRLRERKSTAAARETAGRIYEERE